MPEDARDVLRMITMRSNDQFNTTVYGYSDRFRGIEGTRDVVFMNQSDIDRLGLKRGRSGPPTHIVEGQRRAGAARIAGDAL